MEFVFTIKSHSLFDLPSLTEALLLEMNDNNQKMIVSVFCRFLSQNNREFDAFFLNIDQLLSNLSKRKPTMSIITGDFNARSSSWWSDVIDTSEGTHLYWLTSSNGFSQLINELKHVQTNDSSVLMLFLLMNQICQ